jgi:hypothetical protein
VKNLLRSGLVAATLISGVGVGAANATTPSTTAGRAQVTPTDIDSYYDEPREHAKVTRKEFREDRERRQKPERFSRKRAYGQDPFWG